MRKRVRKLQLRSETLRYLSGGSDSTPTNQCAVSDTCADTCGSGLPVPSVDYCASGAVRCASQNYPGCVSTFCPNPGYTG